jgi:hypothetical protein
MPFLQSHKMIPNSTRCIQLIPVHILSQKRQGTSQPRFIGFEAHLAYCNADSRSVPSTVRDLAFKLYKLHSKLIPSLHPRAD